jgi:hypothetical protein
VGQLSTVLIVSVLGAMLVIATVVLVRFIASRRQAWRDVEAQVTRQGFLRPRPADAPLIAKRIDAAGKVLGVLAIRPETLFVKPGDAGGLLVVGQGYLTHRDRFMFLQLVYCEWAEGTVSVAAGRWTGWRIERGGSWLLLTSEHRVDSTQVLASLSDLAAQLSGNRAG